MNHLDSLLDTMFYDLSAMKGGDNDEGRTRRFIMMCRECVRLADADDLAKTNARFVRKVMA